jgi:Flp pilus assembly pilin Flp
VRGDDVFTRIDVELSRVAGGSCGDGESENPLRCGSRSVGAFAKSEHGQDLIEYALIMAVIALSVVGSMHTFSSKVGNEFNSLENYM